MDFYHKSVVTYSCASPGCFRSYSFFNSYRRHYLAIHNSLQNYNPDVMELSTTQISNVVTTQEQDIDYDQPTCSNTNLQYVSNAPSTINVQNFHKTLAKLGSKLYANPQVPQTVVDDVFGTFSELFNQLMPVLSLEQSENIKNVINSFDSLHKRLKYYENVGTYIKPQTYIVGTRYDFVTRNGRRVYEGVECEAHFIPLRDVLKQFFSMGNILEETLLFVC